MVGPISMAVCRSVLFFFLIFLYIKIEASDSKNILRVTNQQGPLGIFRRTFVEVGYVQNKLVCSKEAVISLKLWALKKSI